MSKIAPSTKTGSHHWLMQKISAIALIPLVIWIALSFVQIIQDPASYLPIFFAYPLNAILGILFICTSLYHGSLGLRVVIEDYISNKTKMHFYPKNPYRSKTGFHCRGGTHFDHKSQLSLSLFSSILPPQTSLFQSLISA